MMNITIGQYYPVESIIHRLDPRVKLASTIVYITMLIAVNSLWSYGLTVLALCVIIKFSHVPPVYLLRGLRGIFFIIIFTVVLNMFFTPGEVLLQVGALRLTLEGVIGAARMCTRLILMITGSSLLTLTTSPIQLTDAIEYLLKPLRRVGVPAHEIAMMMTIALRFIPTLFEEMNKIMKAQMARGADFDTGGLIKKAKSLIPLLVPLFVSSFRRADELAMAMEARCYRGGEGRTRMKVMRLERRDYWAIFCLVFFCFATVFLAPF